MRGTRHVPGAKVEPGFLSILSPGDAKDSSPDAGAKSSGRRLVLANGSPPKTTR